MLILLFKFSPVLLIYLLAHVLLKPFRLSEDQIHEGELGEILADCCLFIKINPPLYFGKVKVSQFKRKWYIVRDILICLCLNFKVYTPVFDLHYVFFAKV